MRGCENEPQFVVPKESQNGNHRFRCAWQKTHPCLWPSGHDVIQRCHLTLTAAPKQNFSKGQGAGLVQVSPGKVANFWWCPLKLPLLVVPKQEIERTGAIQSDCTIASGIGGPNWHALTSTPEALFLPMLKIPSTVRNAVLGGCFGFVVWWLGGGGPFTNSPEARDPFKSNSISRSKPPTKGYPKRNREEPHAQPKKKKKTRKTETAKQKPNRRRPFLPRRVALPPPPPGPQNPRPARRNTKPGAASHPAAGLRCHSRAPGLAHDNGLGPAVQPRRWNRPARPSFWTTWRQSGPQQKANSGLPGSWKHKGTNKQNATHQKRELILGNVSIGN